MDGRPMVNVYEPVDGVETLVYREMNDEEYADWQEQQAALPGVTLAALRAQRDTKLAACDWTQLPDSPLEAASRQAWAEYRQKLRDWLNQSGFDPFDPAPFPPSPDE